jgi:hypothetical protein
MHRFLIGLGTLVGTVAVLADPPPEKPPAEVPELPLAIPGYELRVLDVKKPVVFNVDGSQVEGALPIFVYYPGPARAQAADLVKQAHDDLIKLGGKPEWTGEELKQVIGNLEAALGLLTKN